MRALLLGILLLSLSACGSESARDAFEPGEVTATTLAERLASDYAAQLGAQEAFQVFGAGTSLYYVAEEDSTGQRIFSLVADPAAGAPNDPDAANLLAFFPPNEAYLASKLGAARLSGPIERDSARVYVLETYEPTDIGFLPSPEARDHLARVYIDAETLDIRELFHRFKVDTLSQPFVQRVLYRDYREMENGIRMPFSVQQLQEGMLQIIPEAIRIVRGGDLGIQERQAHSLPIAQRDSALRIIARQKRLLVDGVQETELRIDSVRFGVTPPAQ